MPELPSVSPGDIIASDHINDIAVRSAQRYASEAERDSLNPTPAGGELAYVVSSESFGGSQLFVFTTASGQWHMMFRGDPAGGLNQDGRNFITVAPGAFIGPGAVRRSVTIGLSDLIGPDTGQLGFERTVDLSSYGFSAAANMHIGIYGTVNNQYSWRTVYNYHDLSATSITVRGQAMSTMTGQGTAQYDLFITEYY